MNIFILPRRTPYPTYFSPPRTPYTVTARTPCLIFAGPPAVGGGGFPPFPPPAPTYANVISLPFSVCGKFSVFWELAAREAFPLLLYWENT